MSSVDLGPGYREVAVRLNDLMAERDMQMAVTLEIGVEDDFPTISPRDVRPGRNRMRIEVRRGFGFGTKIANLSPEQLSRMPIVFAESLPLTTNAGAVAWMRALAEVIEAGYPPDNWALAIYQRARAEQHTETTE